MNLWIFIFSTWGVIFLFAEIKNFPSSVTNNMDLIISLSVPAFSLSLVNARCGVSKDRNPWWQILATPDSCSTIHQTADLWYTRQLLYDTPDSCPLIHQTAALWYTRQLLYDTPDSCSLIHQTADLWYTRQLISDTPDSCSLIHQTAAALWYKIKILFHWNKIFFSCIKFSSENKKRLQNDGGYFPPPSAGFGAKTWRPWGHWQQAGGWRLALLGASSVFLALRGRTLREVHRLRGDACAGAFLPGLEDVVPARLVYSGMVTAASLEFHCSSVFDDLCDFFIVLTRF